MSGEQSTDLQAIGAPVKGDFEAFKEETGRELKLEIEPGTFLVANAGSLVCTVQDVVSTGSTGYEFIKLDAGMTELLRPSLYGALHPLVVMPAKVWMGATCWYVCMCVCRCTCTYIPLAFFGSAVACSCSSFAAMARPSFF